MNEPGPSGPALSGTPRTLAVRVYCLPRAPAAPEALCALRMERRRAGPSVSWTQCPKGQVSAVLTSPQPQRDGPRSPEGMDTQTHVHTPHTQTHRHMHTHHTCREIYTDTRTHITHAHIHTDTRTHTTHAEMHRDTCTHITQAETHAHTCTHRYTSHTQTQIHTDRRTRHTHTDTRRHTYKHRYMHTHRDTRRHTHTQGASTGELLATGIPLRRLEEHHL